MLYQTRRKQSFPCNLFDGESCSVGIGQYVWANPERPNGNTLSNVNNNVKTMEKVNFWGKNQHFL